VGPTVNRHIFAYLPIEGYRTRHDLLHHVYGDMMVFTASGRSASSRSTVIIQLLPGSSELNGGITGGSGLRLGCRKQYLVRAVEELSRLDHDRSECAYSALMRAILLSFENLHALHLIEGSRLQPSRSGSMGSRAGIRELKQNHHRPRGADVLNLNRSSG
jgi:hypothetical protein